jgi:pre-mRNA-processing factor 6
MADAKNKLAFLSMPAPASYVAGLGRGYILLLWSCKHRSLTFIPSASGFTTRSDIGPAREGPSDEAIAYVCSAIQFRRSLSHSRHYSEAKAKRGEETEIDPEQYQDPDNEVGLFAGTVYEQDDEEADRIYDEVDAHMDGRRRVRRCVSSSPPHSLRPYSLSSIVRPVRTQRWRASGRKTPSFSNSSRTSSAGSPP